MENYTGINVPLSANFEMRYYQHNSGEPMQTKWYPSHIHDVLEIYILVDGDASFMVEQSLYKMAPGDIILTKPNEMHNCILNSDSVHKHFCFWFDPACEFLFSDFLAHDFGEGNLCSPSAEDRDVILSICGEIAGATACGDTQREFSEALRLLYYIRRNLSNAGSSEPLPEMLRAILDDIHDNLPQIHSLTYFFDKYFVSPSTLNRLFHKYLRTSPKLYLENKRLAYSRILLNQGANVIDACNEAGFSDYSNYIRLFRTRFGVTPLRYRNSRASLSFSPRYSDKL